MKCQSFLFFAAVFALTFAWGLSSLHAADEAALDTATIQVITGPKGVSNQKEGTVKVSKPRDDVSRHDLTPESGGLFAISLGLSDRHAGEDHAVLRDGFIIYDALYRRLKFCRGEKHLWFPHASKPATGS
jgi:hypothetical protein